MRKSILVMATICVLATIQTIGCRPAGEPAPVIKKVSVNFSQFHNGEYHYEVIDSCDYIMGWGGQGNGGPIGMHNGNCQHCWTKMERLLIRVRDQK